MSATMKRTITDWALPLACEKKFSDLADPKLNGKFVEEELKKVILVALVCADSKPEKRLTMLEVLELLKGNSKEKLADLENNDLFKGPQTGGYTDGVTEPEASSDIISEEKDTNEELKEIKPDPGNPLPHGS